ncbi:MAG: signal peptide peptidase SppA [Gemmatimonadota bacterium]
MSARRPGPIRRFFGFLWGAVDLSRRVVVNLLFLAIVVFVAAAWFFEGRPTLNDNTVLVLDIKGPIVEQYTGAAGEAALAQTLLERERETQLRDILTALDAAATDSRITRVLLLLDDFEGAGMPTLHEVAAALERVKAAGKQVVAWGSSYDQRQYYMAAHADEIYMHPFGTVLLRGFGGYRNYYRDALDRLGITVNVFKVGKYKSFAEPFVQNEPSPQAQEDEQQLLDDLWQQYTTAVEAARRLPAGSIGRLIDELPQRFAAVKGDAAQLALREKLIDGLKTRDELRAMLIERGAVDTEHKTFRQIGLASYVALQPQPARGDVVAVVVAAGDIIDGDAPQGMIGGRSTSELVRRAREDDRVKAVVLRVDSPGGSAFGAELIRRELELTRQAGKPVVVSFGDVAASGGYWISMAADEVIADPATVTGSIGVFALLPSVDKAMDKLSLHTAGVTTTWLAGAGDPRRPLDPRVGELIQTGVSHSYDEFIRLAAAARGTTPDKINEIAQGRVWTGRQAKDQRLVDRLGSYTDALKDAATRANLGQDFHVAYVEREPRGVDRLLAFLFGETARALQARLGWNPADLAGPAARTQTARDLAWLQRAAAKPFQAVAHCLCEPL